MADDPPLVLWLAMMATGTLGAWGEPLEPKKPALSSKSGSEKKSGFWRPTKRQVLWVIGMVVALLTTALLIVNLHPEIWKDLSEERNLTLIAIGVGVTAIIVLLAIGGAASRWTGFRGMTVRDWLDLLVVPLALVVISFLFTMQQDQRQQRTETQRADAERRLAEQRAQDEALQAYLDQMGQLMLDRNLLEAGDEVLPLPDPARVLAEARTSTIILRLDAEHNESVTRFLYDSGLTQGLKTQGLLSEMDLSHAKLSNAELPGADLHKSSLSKADLSGANLSDANLNQVDLRDADLSGAFLFDATLVWVRLEEANLSRADLQYTDLGAAFLNEANLSRAYLKKADLRAAHLKGADLSGAFLKEAELTDAHVSEKQLITAKSLEGATMPDGQTLRGDKTPNGPTFEEWLKDRKDSQ